MNLTTQQNNIISALTDTSDNVAIVARAGCGKTSTILAGVDALVAKNPNSKITVCAFNKAIQVEVDQKLRARGHSNWKTVSAATVHSLGFGVVKYAFQIDHRAINGNKVSDAVDVAAKTDRLIHDHKNLIAALVNTAKSEAFGYFADAKIDVIDHWVAMADHYDINGFDECVDVTPVILAAQRLYRESIANTQEVDFNDMILFPLIHNLRVGFPSDVVFVDEAQDLSRARQELIKKFVKRDGRIVLVGDDRQAIYGFAGADANALHNMISDLDATVLPLSVTWRCPVSVVEKAQQIVPDIEAAPSASEGIVRRLKSNETPNITPKTAILCRNTAPLIEMAFNLIRQGIACKVEGRDIGQNMIKLAQRWKVTTIAAFLTRLDTYQEREVAKARAKKNAAKEQAVVDQCDTMRHIADGCIGRGEKSVEDMVAFIQNLFADQVKGVTTLCTYHRSKGREWQHVVMLDHHKLCPSPYARQDWQLLQEENLAYVAITRSESELDFWSRG